MPWWRVNTECSIHRVWHTPSTAYTENSIYWVLHTPRTASSQHRLSPAPGQSLISRQIILYSILYMPTIKSWPMNRVSASIARPFWTTSSRLTTFKSCSSLTWSWPPRASRNSLDYGPQVCLQTRSIIAPKCIFKLAWLRPPSSHDHCLPSVSPNPLDHGLGVHLWTQSITAPNCIFKLARLRPPSVAPNCLITASRSISKPRSIMASKFAGSRPPSASPNSLDHGLRVPL